jgi:hypothetical protein
MTCRAHSGLPQVRVLSEDGPDGSPVAVDASFETDIQPVGDDDDADEED